MVTRLPMPAQEGGAARRDRAQRQRLDRRESMRAAIGIAVGAHEVGEGEAERRDRGRRLCGDDTHGVLPCSRVESIEQIQRGRGPDLRVPGQLKVPRGGTQMLVAQQPLDRVEVDAAFQ